MMSRILLPFIFILVSIGLFIGYIRPTYSTSIAAEKEQIASDDSALSAAATFNAKESALLAQRNAIDTNSLIRLGEYLPDNVNNIQLIIDLEALAGRSGVTLANFSFHPNQSTAVQNAAVAQNAGTSASSATPTTPAATTNTGNSGTPLQSTSLTDSLDVSVAVTGTYPAFQQFIVGTEQSLRPLDITSVDVKDSATGVYSYNVTFRIYWLH